MHAETCPVCKGTGQVTPPNDGRFTHVPQPETCHGCLGTGWVAVPDPPPLPMVLPAIETVPATNVPYVVGDQECGTAVMIMSDFDGVAIN